MTNRYCDRKLLPWVISKSEPSIKNYFANNKLISSLCWVLFCVALSGPRVNIEEYSLINDKKYDHAVALVLDVSSSMLVEDIYPSRISKAKLAINKLITSSGDTLISLVVFSNTAHTVIPLTYDHSVIRDVLPSIQPDMLPVAGSNYVAGIIHAKKLLEKSDAKNKVIFLLSDGDFPVKNKNTHLPITNVPVHVLGFGTNEGHPVPLSSGGWLNFDNKPVISRLNTVKLKAISKETNGKYFYINKNFDYTKINIIKLTGNTVTSKSTKNTIVVWNPIQNWFLIPATFLFIISTLQFNRNTIVAALTMIGVFFAIMPINESIADEATFYDANKAYKKNNFLKAEKLYKKLAGYNALIGLGNSLYRQNNFKSAVNIYSQAILMANSDSSRASALFNLANTYYKIGNYSQAVQLYQDAIKYNSSFTQAKNNLEYAAILYENVKKAIALRGGLPAKSIRPGRGPRSARIEPGVDIGNSKVTLDDSEIENKVIEFSKENNSVINELIKRGVKYSNISTTKIDKTTSDEQWLYDYTTMDMVELNIKQEKQDSHKLWKRLFEIESGFPAPVETPHHKPEVNPW